MEARSNSMDRKALLAQIAPSLNSEEIFVTQGAAGLMYWMPDTGVRVAPGFAPAIVDRVGAGDALLATISLLRINGIHCDIASFYGNIAGALMVGVMGNSISISIDLLRDNAMRILNAVSKHG